MPRAQRSAKSARPVEPRDLHRTRAKAKTGCSGAVGVAEAHSAVERAVVLRDAIVAGVAEGASPAVEAAAAGFALELVHSEPGSGR